MYNPVVSERGDRVKMVTLKQFAHAEGISYEAVRKQVVKYADALDGHVVKQDRTQYLDEYAVEFLKDRRKESPIILQNVDQKEEIDQLTREIETLRGRLLSAQEKIISLQEESRPLLEAKVKYDGLLEVHEVQKARLKEAEETAARERERAEDLRRQREDDQRTIEDLKRERDAAETEAKSFQKSIFGFYRKK